MSADERNLDGRVALVTGSSSGAGAEIALELARRGARVAVHCRRALADAEAVAARIRAAGGTAAVFAADLADPDAPDGLTSQVEARLGKIGVLVNNAGPYADAPFRALSPADFDLVMAVNVKAPYRLAQRVVAGMELIGWGRIINLGATSAYARSHSVYGLAKAALLHLTECLALEFAPLVTVNAITPGQIASTRTDTMVSYKAAAIAETPLGRLVTEQEVGRMAALLCTSEFASVTGRSIVMDGGRSLPRSVRIGLSTAN